MTVRVPNVGEEAFLDLVLSVDYDIKLFVNDVTSGLDESQIEALVAADFTEASFAGYADATLTGGSWTTTAGAPTAGTYAAQTFTRSSTGAAQTVYGWYLVRSSDGTLRCFEEIGPYVIEFDDDELVIVPRITLRDQVDTA